MRARKALLIGAEDYGEGFASLPAARQDLRLMRSALETAGYEVEICREEVAANAGELDRALRKFCSAGGADDVHVVYFTGHGILVDKVDWIVPAGTARREAMLSSTQRVSTDLSRPVAGASTGLVLFIVDACRDEQDTPVTKGGDEWGDPARIDLPGESRFVRLFGCRAGEVCQVLPASEAGGGECGPSSMFTSALADVLLEGSGNLDDLLPKVERRCTELLLENAHLRPQTPHLSYGELTAYKRDVLRRPIFDPVGSPALSGIWPSFDPGKLHCLVVTSEFESRTGPPWGLGELVQDALSGQAGQRIWAEFSAACNGRKLVSGRRRSLPEQLSPAAVSYCCVSVLDALRSADALDQVVRAVAEADLVVFDVTHFEPGVMLLVGIRSACCRWLTICSHGDDWTEGKPIEVPFNLQDLNLNSHAPSPTRVGENPVVERFVRRVETGFRQLARHPRYLDLPAYEALRDLGADYEAWSTLDVKERVLVLCWYAQDFFPTWQLVASQLRKALWEKAGASPRIERIIDYGSSQLIWQSLYEQIRRTAACVVDWSGYSASVFLELGVRLAVSEWGAVQIADEGHLPGGDQAPELMQIEDMRRLLEPIAYRFPSPAAGTFERVADAVLQRNPALDADPAYNRVHRALLSVIGEIEQAIPSVTDLLRARADALHHPLQARRAVPQVLFHGSRVIKQDSERAALELRIAAWLYLEHRAGSEEIERDPALRDLYRDLGRAAADALYDLGDDRSIDFAESIESRLRRLE